MGVHRAVTIAFLATGWLGAQAAPAVADGPPSPHAQPYRYTPHDATPVPDFFEFNWSGFYIGAHLGGAHTRFEANETVNPLDPILFDTLTYAQDGASFVGGVQAGWQKQWEKFVAGVEVSYGLLRFDETTHSPLVPGLARAAELHDLLTLTGRLGYADGRWLAYVKGGWASAEIDVTYRDMLGGVVVSSGGRENGWTAGVGIDYALSHNLFLGIEYNYLHFGVDVPSPPVSALSEDGEVSIQTLVLRLNYRFGGPVR